MKNNDLLSSKRLAQTTTKIQIKSFLHTICTHSSVWDTKGEGSSVKKRKESERFKKLTNKTCGNGKTMKYDIF